MGDQRPRPRGRRVRPLSPTPPAASGPHQRLLQAGLAPLGHYTGSELEGRQHVRVGLVVLLQLHGRRHGALKGRDRTSSRTLTRTRAHTHTHQNLGSAQQHSGQGRHSSPSHYQTWKATEIPRAATTEETDQRDKRSHPLPWQEGPHSQAAAGHRGNPGPHGRLGASPTPQPQGVPVPADSAWRPWCSRKVRAGEGQCPPACPLGMALTCESSVCMMEVASCEFRRRTS